MRWIMRWLPNALDPQRIRLEACAYSILNGSVNGVTQ